jgi:transposase InsO family protein
MSRNFEERICLLIENIAGVTEKKAKKILLTRSSKYIAEAHSDALEYEITACVQDYSCVTSVQKLTLPNDEEWVQEQRKDTKLNQIIVFIEENRLPDDDKIAKEILSDASLYAIRPENRILYRVSKLDPEEKEVSYRRCVPITWRKLILSEFHDSLWSGGHLGRDKTYEAVRRKFYFENMSYYVKIWVASCDICHKTKASHPNHPKAPLGIIDAARPWDLVSIDLWSAGICSRSGNKYVLTMIDVYSKFAFAKPLPNEEETTVAQALIDVFSQFGFPDRLHSDQGAQFTSNLMKEICKFFLVEKSKTTAYHPQGNGTVERLHQFFKNAVSAFVRVDHRDWDEVLRCLMLVYNNAMHSALGTSPAHVALGRSLGSIGYIEEKFDQIDLTQMQYIQRLKYAMQRVQAQIANRRAKKIQKNAELSSDKEVSYAVGDKVALEVVKLSSSEQLSNKLSWKFNGPYEIIRKGRDNKVYYLKDAFNDELPHPVSVDRIKLWVERSVEEAIENPKTISNDEESFEENQGPLSTIDPSTTYTPTLEELKDIEIPVENKSANVLRQSSRFKVVRSDPYVGKRVKVLWPDGNHYFGKVVSKCTSKRDLAEGTHKVKYEDDNLEYYERLDGSCQFEIVASLLFNPIVPFLS